MNRPPNHHPWYQSNPNNPWHNNQWQQNWHTQPYNQPHTSLAPHQHPVQQHMHTYPYGHHPHTKGMDQGSKPYVVDIEKATVQNNTFRTALWTGTHLQLTLMCIPVGEDIGLEIHPHLDQFLRIEEGHGLVRMGDRRDNLYFQENVKDNSAILIPAGTWHNVINTGNKPLKLYSIYAPPQHPYGTVHQTKADAIAAEEHHHY